MKEDHSNICMYLEGRKANEERNIEALTKQIKMSKEEIEEIEKSIIVSKETIKAIDRAIETLRNATK
jgi:septal ring factor EnvC (AmiA/AmiB activator)